MYKIWGQYIVYILYNVTLFLSSVINVMTTPSDVTDVTVWPITSNPNPRVLKIENMKINQNENENNNKN